MDSDSSEAGPTNVGLGVAGAVGGAVVMGIVYGLVGRFVGEYQYIAIAVGAVSGLGAIKLGKGQSIVVGVVAAVATLGAMFAGKLLIPPPEGVTWIEHHTYMFDILFCYVGAPVVAFLTCGTPLGDQIRDRLPF